jgi:hypothetical protein
LLLPGQAAAPEGPVDLAAMYLMHRAFRRDLDAFAAATAATAGTPAADRQRWVRLARRFELFADVLHKHHHGEDVGLWPLLLERGAGHWPTAPRSFATCCTRTSPARRATA